MGTLKIKIIACLSLIKDIILFVVAMQMVILRHYHQPTSVYF
jgi:hypothetical protein